MGLGEGIGNIFWPLAGSSQENPIRGCIERPQLGMSLQIETIRSLGEFEKAAEAICIFSLCEACCQDNQICLFLIGFSQEFIVCLDDQFPGPLINLRRDSLSVKDPFFLDLLIELFTTFSKGPDIDVTDGDPCIGDSILDEMRPAWP